jgi:hypothetical protein
MIFARLDSSREIGKRTVDLRLHSSVTLNADQDITLEFMLRRDFRRLSRPAHLKPRNDCRHDIGNRFPTACQFAGLFNEALVAIGNFQKQGPKSCICGQVRMSTVGFLSPLVRRALSPHLEPGHVLIEHEGSAVFGKCVEPLIAAQAAHGTNGRSALQQLEHAIYTGGSWRHKQNASASLRDPRYYLSCYSRFASGRPALNQTDIRCRQRPSDRVKQATVQFGTVERAGRHGPYFGSRPRQHLFQKLPHFIGRLAVCHGGELMAVQKALPLGQR